MCKIYSVEDDARIVPGDGLYQTFYMYPHDSTCEQIPRTNSKTTHIKNNHQTTTGPRRRRTSRRGPVIYLWQHRTIPALWLKHRSGSCGTASALPKCSIMSGCGTRIVLRGQKPLALCDRCPCFGSPFPPLAALTFAASSIICAFGLASAAPRSPYRHLELCGIALTIPKLWHICHNEICRKVCLRCRGRCSPTVGQGISHIFIVRSGRLQWGAGAPALPYKKLHSVWAVQLHQNYRFVSRRLFRT